jgi:hypothetical protein
MKCSKIKHSRSDTKDDTRQYKDPHRALRCKVLDSSSELRPPADFPVLQWVTTRPHKLATTTAVLMHFYNQKDPQAMLEQVKLSKTDLST